MKNRDKTLKNSVISVFAQCVVFLLQFINRRVFVVFLDIEYLGYQTLFSNVFSLLSVTELGIGSIISFHLYREIAANNEEEIGKLMEMYKWIYRVVAIVVCALGLGCSFFLPFIVTDATQSWSYLRLVYLLQLGSVVLGYFLSYKRVIYIANQQEYRCAAVDLCVSVLVQLSQIVLLIFFHNYLVYLILNLSTSIIANVILSCEINRDFPYLKKKYRISVDDLKKRNIFTDMKDFLIHKVSYTVYNGTDNIIISMICGIHSVALYGNYATVRGAVQHILFYKLLNPVQATIGHIVYSDRPREELWKQFEMLDVFSFFFATYIGTGFLVFFQPFIQLWMGKEYLLSFSFVVLYAATVYVGALFEIVYKYRSVFGDYRQDRNCMVVSAILNIVVSILAAQVFGVAGVQLGTLVALLPIVYGRIRFVVKGYFGKSLGKYIVAHFIYFLLSAGIAAISYMVSLALPVSIIGLLGCGLIVFVIPTVIGCLFFFRKESFWEMVRYLFLIGKDLAKRIRKVEI